MPCQNAPPDNIALLVKFQYLNFPYFFRTNLSKVPGRIRQSNCLRLAGKHGHGHADTDTRTRTRGHGQRGHGQRGHGQRGHGKRGQRGHGQRGHGKLGQRGNGQRGHYIIHTKPVCV